MLFAALPSTSVEDRRCCYHLIKGKNFSAIGGFREFLIRREVLRLLIILSRVYSTTLRRVGVLSANLAYCAEGLCRLRWVRKVVLRPYRDRLLKRPVGPSRPSFDLRRRRSPSTYLNKGNNLLIEVDGGG